VSGKILKVKELPAGNPAVFQVHRSRRPKALRHHCTVSLPYQVISQ